ncbi:SH3 domain-binding glutamic acid-rich-like protein 3 isoform X2 [Stigmatopora nigra]
MGSIVYYYASVSGNMELKKRQQRIEMALDGKGIKYEKVDITASQEAKDKMRAIVGDPTALPPQICNGNQYCGDFVMFEVAVENGELENFLKLP